MADAEERALFPQTRMYDWRPVIAVMVMMVAAHSGIAARLTADKAQGRETSTAFLFFSQESYSGDHGVNLRGFVL